MPNDDLAAIDPRKLTADEFTQLLANAANEQADGALDGFDAATFGRLVKRASGSQLTAVMTSDVRGLVLGEIFRRMSDHFRPDKAGDRPSVIHWRITGRPDGGADEYELVIEDGTCVVSDTPSREPRTTITLGGPEFLQLTSGAGNPVTMFLTRKVKIAGDLATAANLNNVFDIPKV